MSDPDDFVDSGEDSKCCSNDPLLKSLQRHFSDPDNLHELTQCLRGPHRVSLRVLDWLVTNYAKSYNIVYTLNDAPFNIYTNYKAQLRGYTKSKFDPFCRRKRVPFVDSHGKAFKTTVGQLCFFRWGLSKGVVSYCIQHAKLIEEDMLATQEKRHPEVQSGSKPAGRVTKARRKELSAAAVRRCTMTDMPILIRFSF